MTSLFERYRPASWADVVGQDKAVAMLRRLKPGGRAFWFAGPSGSGKTTLARILATEFAESWHVDEIDAQDCNLDFVRAMEAAFAYRGMGDKPGKAWIVNEAHGLRGAILSRFLTLIERLPAHCAVMFTTTSAGQKALFEDFDDASPLLSRCMVVPLAWHEHAPTQPGPLTRAFAERALTIARKEGLDGQPIGAYERLALECRHNLRQMLSRIEAGEMLR
jgi:replication-associated recombination protein RarA